MSKKLTAFACVSIFVLGVAVGLLAYNTPFCFDFYFVIHADMGKNFLEIFTTKSEAVYYRPIFSLWAQSFYNIFGMDYKPYHLFYSFLLGAYGALIYIFHLKVAPEKKATAYISSIIVIMSSTGWFMVHHPVDAEVFQDVFLFAVLIIFLTLTRCEKLVPDVKTLGLFLLLGLFSILAVFSKDTVRGFLPAIIAVFCYFAWKEKKLGKVQILAASVILVFVALGLFVQMIIPSISTSRPALNLPFFFFMLNWHIIQLTFPLFLVGSLVILIASLSSTKFNGIIGMALLVLMFSSPVLVFIPFEQRILLSMDLFFSTPFIFSMLFIAGLAINFFRGERTSRVYSSIILAVLLVILALTFFPVYAKYGTSMRTFFSILPFYSWLVVDSLGSIWKESSLRKTKEETKSRASTINGTLLAVTFVVLFAAASYHILASDYDVHNIFDAQANVEYNTIKQFSRLNLTNSKIYSVGSYPLYTETMELLVGIKSPPRIVMIFPNFDVPKEELGVERRYFYIVKFEPVSELKPEARQTLIGDFRYVDDGNGDLWQRMWYSANQTPLEESLDKNATKIVEYRQTFYQVPRSLADSISRYINSIPWIIEYEQTAAIYYSEIGS